MSTIWRRRGSGLVALAGLAAVLMAVAYPGRATPLASAAPGPPSGLTATVKGSQVSLRWSPATRADGYDVYEDGRRRSGPGASTATPSATLPGVADGPHLFAVSSYNKRGEGAVSAPVLVSVGSGMGAVTPGASGATGASPAPAPGATGSQAATSSFVPSTARPVANGINGGLGIYPGDAAEPAQMQLFQTDLTTYGVPADTVVLMIDNTSEAGFRGSTWGHFIQPGAWEDYGADKPAMVVSVPLAIGGFDPGAKNSAANLEDVINGVYDGAYQYLADALVGAGYPGAVIRLGWEFDGNWMPWEATNHPDLYIAAFRHVHDIFAAASSTFRYDWEGAAGQAYAGTLAYPGDAYVDIIGMVIYDANVRLGRTITTLLSARRDFAVAHGKQVSYGEWGNLNGDHPAFIKGMYDWFASLPPSGPGSLAYESYYLGGLGSLSRYPQSRALYKQLFAG